MMTRKEQFVLTLGAVSIIAGAATLYALKGPSKSTEVTLVDSPEPSIQISAEEPRPPEIPPSMEPTQGPGTEPMIAVSIVGAVKSPGVYRFSDDARIEDLLLAAGGSTAQANLGDINRAAKLIDGTTLNIPSIPGTDRGPKLRDRSNRWPRNPAQYTVSGWAVDASHFGVTNGATAPSATAQHPSALNVNTASQKELESLPGIGPVYAAAIIQYRLRQPFASIDELENVSGIGPKRLESIRHLVRVH